MVYQLLLSIKPTQDLVAWTMKFILFMNLQGFATTVGAALTLGPEMIGSFVSDVWVGRLRHLGSKLLGAPLSLHGLSSMGVSR